MGASCQMPSSRKKRDSRLVVVVAVAPVMMGAACQRFCLLSDTHCIHFSLLLLLLPANSRGKVTYGRRPYRCCARLSRWSPSRSSVVTSVRASATPHKHEPCALSRFEESILPQGISAGALPYARSCPRPLFFTYLTFAYLERCRLPSFPVHPSFSLPSAPQPWPTRS